MYILLRIVFVMSCLILTYIKSGYNRVINHISEDAIMEFGQLCLVVVLLVVRSHGLDEDIEPNDAVSNQTATAYSAGVRMGIINPEKYSLRSFEQHERDIFKDTYREYLSLNGTQPISYQDWLVMNNYGILLDTQESMFQRKLSKRSTADNKRRFVNTVRRGDILITGRGSGGLLGHAAIMTTDTWVLEMPGGRGWQTGIKDNNRQITKDRWFDVHASDWTTVYRCPDTGIAQQAARWADHKYYNPSGGSKKTIHITYALDPNFKSTNPSYCSKLVLQAYYFGTGSNKVIRNPGNTLIVPTTIPTYFLRPYNLANKGKF
uniref:Uncharacterized protein n=1 Tax=Heliothis virescens TaxID=7102 RepID=A0A2A4JTC1_HELVI